MHFQPNEPGPLSLKSPVMIEWKTREKRHQRVVTLMSAQLINKHTSFDVSIFEIDPENMTEAEILIKNLGDGNV